MSSLRPQDRKSLCRFTFADGRQCRTPRSPAIPTSAPTTPAKTPGAPPINSHPGRSEGSQPIPATPFARSNAPAAAQPSKPPGTASSTPRPTPAREAHAIHFDHNCRLLIDGKPF
jgi:hypothetical protein